MRYKAKVDWWIAASLLSAVVLPIAGAAGSGSKSPAIVGVVALVVILGLLYPQWYETAPDALVVRAGLTTRRIPYQRITAVRASSDSGSSLALSLDRILVEYGNRRLLIAPRDQDAFFADIQSRAPQLSKRGQDLEVSFV